LDLVDREAERQTEYALGFLDGRVELYQVYNLVAVERRSPGGRLLTDTRKIIALKQKVPQARYGKCWDSSLSSVLSKLLLDIALLSH
jgi:hypothetical protein